MTDMPYYLVLEVALSANGTGTVTRQIPQNEMLQLYELVYNSTGTFNVTDIRTADGRHYTNASPSTEIPSGVLANGANDYNALKILPSPLILEGGETLYLDLEDSSGSTNTVTLVFSGIRSVQ